MFIILIILASSQALRINIQHEGDVNYEELVVDENGEDSLKYKNNNTKAPSVGTAIFKTPKHKEETLEDLHIAQHGLKLEDLIGIRDGIADFIVREIHKRLNSNVISESNDPYPEIILEPDDIIPEDKLQSLDHKF